MITIKPAELNDLDALAILFDGYRVFYEQKSDVSAGKEFLQERLKNGESKIFVALNGAGKMTGFVQLYPIFSSTRMKRLWLLNDLFVDPDFRGQGISKALIEEAKKLCVDSESCGMILETAKSNEVGNSLYPRTSFVLDKEHNYYFWDN